MKGIGEIILLHVVPKGARDTHPEEAVKTAEHRISEICDHLTLQGIKARIMVLPGKPEIEIARIAQEEDVSLIWMRSKAQGCLHDFFFRAWCMT
jgi:nucleotide-binding universal stress UspA family protein